MGTFLTKRQSAKVVPVGLDVVVLAEVEVDEVVVVVVTGCRCMFQRQVDSQYHSRRPKIHCICLLETCAGSCPTGESPIAVLTTALPS